MEFLFTYGLYTLAILLIVCGLAGTIVPALPGIPMIFIGGWIIAYIDDYQYIGMGTLIALGVLTAISIAIDWLSQTMGAQKAGATKQGLTGALLGTIVGIPFGLLGIFLFPIKSFISERKFHYITLQDFATPIFYFCLIDFLGFYYTNF